MLDALDKAILRQRESTTSGRLALGELRQLGEYVALVLRAAQEAEDLNPSTDMYCNPAWDLARKELDGVRVSTRITQLTSELDLRFEVPRWASSSNERDVRDYAGAVYDLMQRIKLEETY